VLPIAELLTSTEQADVRVMFQRDGQLMQLQDYFEIDSLSAFAAKAQSSWLIRMIEEERLLSWFQPIVRSADSSRIFAYECLLRGQDGSKLAFPDRILAVAKGAGLLFQLDRAARLTHIHSAASFGIKGRIFINFTPTSIYDPVNCLRSTVEAVDEVNLPHDRVVFEVIESEHVADASYLRRIMDFYREQGFGVALDDIGSGYSSLNLLSQLRPDFIKLDRELITNVDGDAFKGIIAQKLLETAQELEIATIAEGVETEGEAAWLCGAGADYMQGYYFARPATPPPLLDQQ
jgi:EAL domain-containing protein (putative c-di-GMP-specific phosphodiesterase class I)